MEKSQRPKAGIMASMLNFACIILSVFLSLGFGSAHRLLLDQNNGGHTNTGRLHRETVQLQQAKSQGVGDGHGTGSRSGPGGTGHGIRRGEVVYGSGSGPGSVPTLIIPLPEIPEIPAIPIIPGVPGRVIGPCVRGGHTQGSYNGIGYFEPDPPYEHQTPGGSATGAVKVVQEATHIVSKPYPPDAAFKVANSPPDVDHKVPPPPKVAHTQP